MEFNTYDPLLEHSPSGDWVTSPGDRPRSLPDPNPINDIISWQAKLGALLDPGTITMELTYEPDCGFTEYMRRYWAHVCKDCGSFVRSLPRHKRRHHNL